MKNIIAQRTRYDFYLRDYNDPIELSRAIGQLKITRMVYSFVHLYYNGITLKTDVIKYGKGADLEWQRGTWGSRVYRQAGNITGWNRPLTGDSGKEMREDYIPTYQQRTGRNVDKNQIIVLIWDFTDYKFLSEDQFDVELRKVENYFIEEYRNKHGINPAGNVISESAAKNASVVSDATWNNLFAEVKEKDLNDC